MATEIELKLQLTAQTARHMPNHPLLQPLSARRDLLLNTYYDTPELALTARRVALRFRKKGEIWLLTVKSAEPAQGGLAIRSEWETVATPGVFDFSHVDQSDLRQFLESIQPRLKPIFTTHFERQRWIVPFGHSSIELALDQGQIESQGRNTPICEVELELLSGEVDDLFGLTHALQEDLDLHPAPASKAERGYALFHDQRPEPVHFRRLSFAPDLPASEAFKQMALACLEQFQRNEPHCLNPDDPEYVHQARIALRRLRSALYFYRPALPKGFSRTWKAPWRDLSRALGNVRNYDICLNELLPLVEADFPAHRTLQALRQHWLSGQKAARSTLALYLENPAHARHVVDFMSALFNLPTSELTIRHLSERGIEQQQMAIDEKMQTPLESAEARHELRLHLKRLRYSLEGLSPLFGTQSLNAFYKALTPMLDRLGHLNDLATALALLPTEKFQLAAGWLAGQQHARLDLLPARIEAFAPKNKIKIKKS